MTEEQDNEFLKSHIKVVSLPKIEWKTEEQYENYGDANPLMHGGIWVKKIGETEYEIIKNDPEDETLSDLTVDISDHWLQKHDVMSYIGMTEETFDPIHFAIGCTDYHSPDNFGSFYRNYNEEKVIKFLKNRGITI